MPTTNNNSNSFLLDDVPPMGIYETLYAFRDSFGQFMGTEGTHPWSQGFPLTTPLEKFDGPALPDAVDTFFARALAKEPAARFQSATDLAQALREACLGADVSAASTAASMGLSNAAPAST